jgi:hypothetical protein
MAIAFLNAHHHKEIGAAKVSGCELTLVGVDRQISCDIDIISLSPPPLQQANEQVNLFAVKVRFQGRFITPEISGWERCFRFAVVPTIVLGNRLGHDTSSSGVEIRVYPGFTTLRTSTSQTRQVTYS